MIETLFSLIENSRGWNVASLALVMLILHILASSVAVRMTRGAPGRMPGRLGDWANRPYAHVIYELLRLGFYAGVPFVVLYVGWIDLRSVGLSQLDWAEGLRWAIVLFLASWLALMGIWLPYLRSTADVFAPPTAHLSFARRMVELLYMQLHWAFYRAAGIALLTGVIPDALYWGTFLGLVMVVCETFADPRVWPKLAQPGQADLPVWNLCQALLNTLAFVYTRNLLLLGLIHWLLEVTVPHLRPVREPVRTAPISRGVEPAASSRGITREV